ncbi:RagB/SusD family nutrient uptake outer membrane protein [Fodinibius sediminis]|uniref:Starch-binding associating with outer membrane n=1 Tax=Fodinibius sediminis TaxID=1214077 RepID=A0A521AVE4_9BACT|nr:RagB/SusD family nutrient uptake outer membrane protein [Fodinibius sediminis]SMO38813.1 Starch-binding associating with outer membrane [Fodinibius sediminis]
MGNHKKSNNQSLYFISPLVLIFTIILLSSCDLTENPSGTLTVQTTPLQNESDLNAMVVGAYRSLPEWTGGAGDYGNYMPCSIEFQTGKATSEDSHPLLFRFQNDNVTGTLLDDFNVPWERWYQGIRDANFAITRIKEARSNSDIAISESSLGKALGEVRTLRAFYYFNIVRYYGSAVLDTTYHEGLGNLDKPRTSLKTIYDEVIIPDLEFAVNESGLEDIPVGANGRLTRYVSRVILADVYLTAAGYPYQEVATAPEQNWSEEGLWEMEGYPVQSNSAEQFLLNAQEQLQALYGQYSLGELNVNIHDLNGEAIFQAHYNGTEEDNEIVAAALPSNSRISTFGSEYGTFIPTEGYINSYDPDDQRLEEDNYFFKEDRVHSSKDASEPFVTFDRRYLAKFYDEEAIKETGQSSINWTFYRYADALLMLTEVNWALKELGATAISNDQIVKGINEVRERAGLSGYNASEVDLKAILSERAYELVFENKMLWDQRRTRKALVVGDGEFSELVDLMGHQPRTFSFQLSAKHLLSPIGGTEMQVNPEMTQNFGYTPQ